MVPHHFRLIRIQSLRALFGKLTCLHGIEFKKKAMKDYCKTNNISLKQTAFVGNDFNDKEAMEIAGVTFCPADAHKSIKSISDHVLKTKGGDGVIRELLDLLTSQERE